MHISAIPVWTLQDRLRKARESAGLKQSQLAKILGVATGSVQRWEKGAHEPRMGTLQAFAEATNVPLEWLLSGGENLAEKSLTVPVNVTFTVDSEGIQVVKVEQG